MKDRREKRMIWLWSALLFFLLLSLTCLAVVLFPSQQGSAEAIPIALHSELSANYNADSPSTPIPNLQVGIIEDVIRGEATSAAEVPERLSTVENILKTPVPTVTPIFTPIVFITPPPQPTLGLGTPTRTLPQPTRTRQPHPTKLPKPTKQPKPTQQPKPTKQPRPTQNPPLFTSTSKPSKKLTSTNVLPTVTLWLQQPTTTPFRLPSNTSTPVNKTETPLSTATPFPTLPIIIPPLTPTPLPTLPIIIPTQNLFGPL